MVTRSISSARRFGLPAGLFALAFAVSALAADPPAPPQKQKGDEAMDKKDFANASRLYAEAYAASHDPVILFNLGRAQQFDGDLAGALRSLERFAKDAPEDVRARVPKLESLVEQLRAQTALLSLSCEQAGATVVLDGREIGTTPLADPTYTNLGPGRLEVRAPGYRVYTSELELAARRAVKEVVHLALAQALRVEATPNESSVAIDGLARGFAPVVVPLPPGAHDVLVTRDGFEKATNKVDLKAGQDLLWRTNLEAVHANESILGRWWFWTAIGVVAAGTTASVIAATTTRSPHAGSIGPGVVVAP